MDNILEIDNISKSFGAKKAIEDISFCVQRGTIFGLLGPNGAGKTTLIRIINQIMQPDKGKILLDNEQLNPEHTEQIGYLPEERGLYKNMSVEQVILYLGSLKGMSSQEAKKEMNFWLNKFDIQSWSNKKIHTLSKGMQQKIQFITTVLHKPKLLIFDEPFSGFDPLNAQVLQEEIMQLSKQGATIIFSTHNMESVEQICKSIVLINNSHNILEGEVNMIKKRFKKDIFEIIVSKQDCTNLLIEHCQLISQQDQEDKTILQLKIDKGYNSELISNILAMTDIISYREILPSMNQIFIQTIKSNQQ